MTWFKADDGFYDHPKVLGLSMAARGLWITAGTWCAKHLTDGVIPARQVRALGGTPAQTRALIQHGLWFESEDDSGAKSYAFHGWNDMQPSRKEILESREREREKKREWRKRKDREQGKRENVPGGQDGGQDGGLPGVVPAPRPDPSRPDPTRPDHLKEQTLAQPSGSSERDRPRRFDEFWAACPRKVGKQKARTKYAAAVKRAGDEQTVIDGMRRLAADPNLPEAQFIPHPTTWLERNGWEDDPLPARGGDAGRTFGTRPEDWLREPPPEAPWDYVDGEVLDTKELT